MGCFTSIFSFGDSLADTGNLLLCSQSDDPPRHFALPPYGQTYFHRPTGRCSYGRLIIDFIAQRFGFDFIPPYLSGGKGISTAANFQEGANFAVVGATALDESFLKERGIHNTATNNSLGIQLGWFKDMLTSLCNASSNCSKFLSSSLVLVGEIGGNDFHYAFSQGRSMDEIQSLELIDLGAVTLMVPGNLPTGCSLFLLTYFRSSDEKEYDPKTGCLIWLNKFSEYYNEMLRKELNQIQQQRPHATIIYADYYNAAMRFYRSPHEFGFTRGALTACCGGGGPYNYNSSVPCGYPPSTSCNNPFLYVGWDGVHLTEAAYRWISNGLLEGQYTIPPIDTSCLSSAPSANSV